MSMDLCVTLPLMTIVFVFLSMAKVICERMMMSSSASEFLFEKFYVTRVCRKAEKQQLEVDDETDEWDERNSLLIKIWREIEEKV